MSDKNYIGHYFRRAAQTATSVEDILDCVKHPTIGNRAVDFVHYFSNAAERCVDCLEQTVGAKC